MIMLEREPLRIRMLGLKKQFQEFGRDMLLLVEGPDDKNLVEIGKNKKNWSIFPVGGKQGVIDGCTPLEEDEETIYGLIDQDYDWIINNSELHDSIIKIDENNIEMMLFENILSKEYCILEPNIIQFIVDCAKEIGILRATCHIQGIKASFKPIPHQNTWFASSPFFDSLESKDLTKFKSELYISFKEYGKNKRDIDMNLVKNQSYDGPIKNHLLINGKDLFLLIALAERNNSSNLDFTGLAEQMSTRLTNIATQNPKIIRNSSLGQNLATLDIWKDE